MGLYAIEGDVGAGKTFCAVNDLMADYLRNTNRPVYTNLPCDREQLEFYLAWLSSSAVKRNEMRRRLRFLHPGMREAWEQYWLEIRETEQGETFEKEIPWPEDDDQAEEYRQMGYRLVRRKAAGLHDGVAEFWYFVEPNSVVFLDELADIYNALDSLGSGTAQEEIVRDEKGAIVLGKNGKALVLDLEKQKRQRRRILQSFINHHRHYKIDLYFFMQSRDDVDVQVRKKIANVFFIENSKRVNMTKWWALRGLRWPVQFFRVRMFVGRKVLGKGADFDSFEAVRAYNVWPTRRRFKNYRSFSAAATGLVRGLRTARATDRSTDMDSVWDRVRDWVLNAGLPLGVGLGFVVMLWMGWRFVLGLAGTSQADTAKWMGVKKGTNDVGSVPLAVGNAASALAVGTNAVAGTNVVVGAELGPRRPPEAIVFVSPVFARSTERTFRAGLRVGPYVPEQFFASGFWSGGKFVPWGVLLRSEPGESR